MASKRKRKGGWGGPRPGAGAKPKASTAVATVPAEPKAKAGGVPFDLHAIVEASRASARTRPRTPESCPFRIAIHPPRATPARTMAMDDALVANNDFCASDWLAGGNIVGSMEGEGLVFLGFPVLGELAQRAEYRIPAESIAEECTRKWIHFDVTGDEDENRRRGEKDPVGEAERRADPDEREKRVKQAGKSDKVKALKDDQDRLEVRHKFYCLSRDDNFFGRSHLYINLGEPVDGDPAELSSSIGDGRDLTSRTKVQKGSLARLETIEAMWCYPQVYNARYPSAPDWYRPQQWYVQGQEFHVTRLLPFVGRPVADMLKPAYSFGGLSLSQLMQPYVNIWLETRAAVAELIHSFSVMVLSTDLGTLTQPGNASSLLARAAMFNITRDNQGVFILNKATEEFSNVQSSLAGLHELQAQSQEHMTFPSRMPLVKFTGIQPMGLNASSEGEIRSWYDTCNAYQGRFMRPGLARVVNFEQLSLWGEIDPEITFDFEPLWEMSAKEKAELQKQDADRDGVYIDKGVLAPVDVRERIADDPDLPYTNIDPDDVPDLAQEEAEGLQPGGKQPGGGENDDEGGGGEERGGASDSVIPFADILGRDDWAEADHPRGQPGNAGQFGPGGGSSKSSEKQKITAPQLGMPHGTMTASHGFAPPAPKSNIGAPIDTKKLTKVGGQKGSNPGGVYEGEGKGKRFYVKQGKTKDHVRNEMTAAALYDLAGTPTLKYRPVEGGAHVATEMEKLDKDNASKLSPEEKAEAARDFAVHAWLGNWDAVGLGGDNLGTIDGVPVPLDLGGALEYRAQGAPKGKAFGDKVTELASLRDPAVNADAAGVFGDMTPAQMRESARYVASIPDAKIRAAVKANGGTEALANKLIARKEDVAAQARTFGAEGDPKKATSTMVVPIGSDLPVKTLNGVAFKPWRPPGDWAGVDGQVDLDEPELETKGKKAASGVVIREKDGRVWLVQPRGGFGGYEATFPKGGAEEGLSLQANAIKEAYEETGLKVRIVGLLGDHAGDVTMTRYYVAEREGGDPSRHEDEAEGVVLAPKDKVPGFLNRARDLNVLSTVGDEQAFDAYAGAEDEFNESAHPRGAAGTSVGGQFVKGGGGGGASTSKATGGASAEPGGASKSKKTAFGGLWKATPGENPAANFHTNAAHVLSKPANAGSSYRQMLAFMIKEAPKHGHGSMVPSLQKHLLDAWTKAGQKLYAAGDQKGATAISNKLAQMEKQFGVKAPAPGPLPESSGQKAAANKYSNPEPKPVTTNYATPKFPAPTEAELAKAKKSVALQLQYVPGAPNTPDAQKLVDAFNKKYAGKEMTSQPELIQKVNDFKGIVLAAQSLGKMEEEKAAAAAKEAAEFEAKKDAVAVEEQLKANPADKQHFDAMAELLKHGSPSEHYLSEAAHKLKSAGLAKTGITPQETAAIIAYSGSHYGTVNKQLRTGALTPEQYNFTKMLNAGLDRLPVHTEPTGRKADLTPEQFSLYKTGMIVEERGFTSSSKNPGTWSGSHQYTIHGKTGRDISKISSHPGEAEVLFKSGTRFLVKSVQGKHITLMEV